MIDDPNLSKSWSRETFDYYSTALLWLRIVNLKLRNNQDLTQLEESLLQVSSNLTFNVPEPIRLYLMGIGNVVSKTGQHLYPSFPELPHKTVDSIPATYGKISVQNHNLYEEIPCLGISIGLIRATMNPVNPLPQWNPPLMPQHYTSNENLLGYHNIRRPRAEALSILDAAGIDEGHFPNFPNTSGFNFNLLRSVSAILANTKTFKVTPVNFQTLSESGSVCQFFS